MANSVKNTELSGSLRSPLVVATLSCHCDPALSLRGTKQSIGLGEGNWIATALRASQ
jgi:hypothetical protein